MAVTISGTTGIAGVDGSAGTPAVQGADANTGMFFPAADTIAFAEGGAEVARFDSSGNLGIGTSSPSEKLSVNGPGMFKGQLANLNANSFSMDVQSSPLTARLTAVGADASTYLPMIFAVCTTTTYAERARIDTSGNLLVGSTTTGYTDSRLVLSLDNSTKWVTGPGAGIATRFYVSASNAGGVYLNGTSATSWTAISDERYKTDLTPIADGLAKVCSLRAVTGRLTTDEIGTSKAFLIAQDVLAVLPEAVDTTDPDRYGLAYTDTIPLMVAAIKELSAKLDAATALIVALQADVAALKGAQA